MEFSYESLNDLALMAESRNLKLSELVLMEQASVMEKTEFQILADMEVQYDVMHRSVE